MSRSYRIVLVLLAAGLASSAAAQTARPAGGPKGAEGAPPQGPPAVMAPAGSFALSGAIYLFSYVPNLRGVKDNFEIYAYLINVDATSRDGKYGLHVQTRFRDSKLRAFFLSNMWFQEAYAYRKTPAGDVRVGKFYRKVGILWDDSFFGDVQYFNGLKLNPDYGAELVGTRTVSGKLFVDYSGQFLANNDHVAGSLFGRDVESDPNARLLEAWTGRVVPTWKLGHGTSLGVGVSGLVGRIERTARVFPTTDWSFGIRQGAADVTFTGGPSISYAEILRQTGEPFDAAHRESRPGYDTATYLLLGTRWQVLPWLNARINYSQAEYDGQKATERETVPGLLFKLDKSLYCFVEYDYWKIDPDLGPDLFVDKSFNFVANYNF